MAKTEQRPEADKQAVGKSIIVYTAVIGKRDVPRTDIPCFTTEMGFVAPVMNAKIYKVLPHKFFNPDISIWIDGNFFLQVSKEQAAELLGDADIAVFKHASRTNIYQEGPAIKRIYPHLTELVDEQIKAYQSMGVPESLPLAELPFIIRRHNDITAMFNEAWWAEICRYSPRDQLSFPVAAAQFPELKVKYIEGTVYTHPYLKRINHNG